MKTVSFQGDISSLALADVVQNLAGNKKTGTLTIHHDGVDRRIHFGEGKILGYGDSRGFSVAQWLCDKGLLERKDLDEALRRYRKAKKKSLGEILRDLKLVSLQEYTKYLTELTSETLYEVLSFREGSFEFNEGNPEGGVGDREARSVGLDLSAANVVMEAARRMDDWQNVRTHIPSESEIYHVPPSERSRLLEEAEDELTAQAIEFMDGTRSVKQVIAQLPYSRFDACRCVAQMVAEKKVRLVGSSELMQNGRTDVDPKEEIACLKTILEREPNNRDIMKRLADLHEQQGDRSESVTFNKLLAMSHLDDEDLEQAEEYLRKALRLNPRDIATWKRLWEVVRRQGDQEKMASFGSQYATHFKRLGLVEVARDHLLEMTKLFPGQPRYKIELADVSFALGDRKACVQGLFELARDLVNQQRLEEAERIFARILKYDRNNQRAREYYEKIRSGMLAQRRALRRRLVRRFGFLVVFALVAGFVAYDLFARTALMQATQRLITEEVLADGNYDDAITRINKVRSDHRWSLSANLEARGLLETLERKRVAATTQSSEDQDSSGEEGENEPPAPPEDS